MDAMLTTQAAEAMVRAFEDPVFLQRLRLNRADTRYLISRVDWDAALETLLPFTRRLDCAQALELCRPMLEELAPEPEGGWLLFAYRTAAALLYPDLTVRGSAAQRDGALCFLQVLRVLLDEERRELPFDPRYDFAFCTEEELEQSCCAEEYRRFLERFRMEHVYELMRLGREVTPFRTLEHIAGVHHVSMTVSRAFAAAGGLVDLALMSGAAAGHDIGKFGCKAGERVPYLHYHYTSQWFSRHDLHTIGHIAANHSVWDLEIENLSAESLFLVYADFRVKQSRDDSGNEIARIYSLAEAFDVILSKLDNVDAAKRRRYRFVYSKLRDFEEYVRSFGVDVTLAGKDVPPAPRTDAALLTPEQVVSELRRTAVDHNIRLMRRLTRDQLFASVLEAARSEKSWSRVRAYISVLEEYFTYLSSPQKDQTLDFLYELLMNPDGDIRRQAATLMGRILALYHSGYKKELPAGAAPDPADQRPFRLWAEYLERLLFPDGRLTPVQISKIRYTAKLVVDALLDHCSAADGPRFSQELLRHYSDPARVDRGAAFALLDTAVGLPAARCGEEEAAELAAFAAHWLNAGGLPERAAALRLLDHLLTARPKDRALHRQAADCIREMDCGNSAPLLFLQARLGRILGMDVSAQEAALAQPEVVSNVFLDNLKTATQWVLKSAGVEYLLFQAGRDPAANVLHIATHFSNLMKVSEHVVVRRQAGASLLAVAPALTPDRRNEIAVELSKSLETGQAELSKYIPEFLGRFALWLNPRELDEVIAQMEFLLSSPSDNVVSAALSTIGSMLEYYAEYPARFRERARVSEDRRRRLTGLLLRGLASYREPVRQEALRILGEELYGSRTLAYEEKTALFTLTAKKALCLIQEMDEQELTFFYVAAALSHIYRFIVRHSIDSGPFQFVLPPKAAFFPGTFDPFSLSHKGIVQNIRDLGFEVYLAVDEFSWSKKAQPSLIRRQLVSMSVADEFDVYLFPHDIPVNLANPGDLDRLRGAFAGRELYLAVGSDVVANASSYKVPPTPGSVQTMNHIVFRRASDNDGHEIEADLTRIRGQVIQLQLPTHLEDISSTRIRENIDLGRDISNLIDPTVQDYIYRNSLYLREPQYKPLIRVGALEFSYSEHPDDELLQGLRAFLLALGLGGEPDPRDSLLRLRDTSGPGRALGFLTMRVVNAAGLRDALGSAAQANYIRSHTAGRLCLITGLYELPRSAGGGDAAQLLLTEALIQALTDDCSYAVYAPWGDSSPETDSLLSRSGFLPVGEGLGDRPLMLVDMRAPAALIQNIPTTLKEPFASDGAVLSAVRTARLRFQSAVCGLYPGSLVLSLNAEVIYHRLVQKIVELNGVPPEPTFPRVLGPKMCVPFGKILRGNAIPNTVTKTIHTDKVFAPDLRSFTIEAFPGYAPLDSQIHTIKSFQRPVILVDDLLHSSNRFMVLDPMLRKYSVPIDRVLVGLISAQGRDLMASRGISADSVYFVPNLRSWFIESTMYPFIGGDTVSGAKPSVPGLTPAINLILPYAFPNFYRGCAQDAVFRFSRTCIENSRDILAALEVSYRERFARNLTLSRLNEAVILPLSPDKGNGLSYDPNLPASLCLEYDLQALLRSQIGLD